MPCIGDRHGVQLPWPALRGAARVLASELPEAKPGSHVAFAFEHDHAAFVTALLAAWQRDHAVALPVDARRPAVGATLRLPEVVAFVHDTAAGTGFCVPRRSLPEPTAADLAVQRLPIGNLTSCTPVAGDVQRTSVPAAELLRQLAAFLATDQLRAGDRLAVTYAPGHLPALIPGVLGPLQAAASVVAAVGLPIPALLARLTATGATHLLTSPDRLLHLSRLPAGAIPRLRAVFTLAEPDAATVARWQTNHGVSIEQLREPTAAERAQRTLREALLACPGVEDVAMAQAAQTETAAAPRWLIAVAGTKLPRAELAACAAALYPDEPPPVLVVVERLARDVNGELHPSAVFHACGWTGDGRLPARQLRWLEPDRTNDAWQCAVELPSDFAGFEGHFVGHPVLSGAVQLHDLVLPALHRAFGHDLIVKEYCDLKFLARIQPGETIQVTVRIAADHCHATFALSRGAVPCTVGHVRWTQR